MAFAIETLGPWSCEAKHLVSDIGNRLNAISGDTRCLHYLRQRIGLAVQRGNVISILGSFPEDIALEEIYYETRTNYCKYIVKKKILQCYSYFYNIENCLKSIVIQC